MADNLVEKTDLKVSNPRTLSESKQMLTKWGTEMATTLR